MVGSPPTHPNCTASQAQGEQAMVLTPQNATFRRHQQFDRITVRKTDASQRIDLDNALHLAVTPLLQNLQWVEQVQLARPLCGNGWRMTKALQSNLRVQSVTRGRLDVEGRARVWPIQPVTMWRISNWPAPKRSGQRPRRTPRGSARSIPT